MSDTRAVRVITEVGAVDRPFDYGVTQKCEQVAVGDRVRIDFHHRSVRGWVVAEVPVDRELKPLTKWLGYGPPPRLLETLTWASQRWCSPLSRFLISSSPKRIFTTLPVSPAKVALAANVARAALVVAPGVVQLAPTTDPLGIVLGAYETCRSREGSLLVLVPGEAWARRLRGRLEQRGCAVASGDAEWDRMRAGWPVIVGSRAVAFAPTPRVAGAVIIDADDEAYRSEAAPTWDAVTALRERCRRDDAPLWCTSMIPSPALLHDTDYQRDAELVGGWPRLVVVDRRASDPRDGALARDALDASHRALAGDESVAVAVVLQRLGTGRLFACAKCGELARCAHCAQAEVDVDGQLACRDRHEVRANFCTACGATNLKRLRVGVTTLARDVAAQLGQPVSEVTAATDPTSPLERVVVGTEALWTRVRRCGVVIFVDFDQYLLAARESSRRDAVLAVGRAGRLVGSRREGRGEVVVQTRRGDDAVLRALVGENFGELIRDDVRTARLLGLAPYGAWAQISGEAAGEFVARLAEYDVTIHPTLQGFEIRADDATTLSEALHAVPRPSGKLRIAVR